MCRKEARPSFPVDQLRGESPISTILAEMEDPDSDLTPDDVGQMIGIDPEVAEIIIAASGNGHHGGLIPAADTDEFDLDDPEMISDMIMTDGKSGATPDRSVCSLTAMATAIEGPNKLKSRHWER